MTALTRAMCVWCNLPPSNSWLSNQRCIVINGILESKKYCDSSWVWWHSCNPEKAEARGTSVQGELELYSKILSKNNDDIKKKILSCQIAFISLLDTDEESHNSPALVKLLSLGFGDIKGKRTMWKPRPLQTQLKQMLLSWWLCPAFRNVVEIKAAISPR